MTEDPAKMSSQAWAAVAAPEPQSPRGERHDTTVLLRFPRGRSLVERRAVEVLAVAGKFEPDHRARLAWYREDPIACLGGRTAETLVLAGCHAAVIAFLERLAAPARD